MKKVHLLGRQQTKLVVEVEIMVFEGCVWGGWGLERGWLEGEGGNRGVKQIILSLFFDIFSDGL